MASDPLLVAHRWSPCPMPCASWPIPCALCLVPGNPWQVLYKHQLEVEEKKKKAMDKHLDFLLGQTER